MTDAAGKQIETLKRENEILKEELKNCHMTLAAIKTLVHRNSPLCSQKLSQLLDACEGCKGNS